MQDGCKLAKVCLGHDLTVGDRARIYADAIGRGCDHPHAVRILARAWIRVIYRCWLDGIPYDPAVHGASGKITRQPGDQHAA